jgi:uncharacterized repeat protein (TIGR01451 family)
MPAHDRGIRGGLWTAAVLALGLSGTATADVFNGNPSNYLPLVGQLQAGDTLVLAAGTYTGGLTLTNKNGTALAPIVIVGPASGPAAVFRARSCCNTVSFRDSSYVEVRNLELDGLGMPGIDAVKAEGDATFAHHITLENLYIHGHDGDQQTVGISTKCPAWDWVVRGNVIATAGTGMYFGDSNGDAPFVNSLIEGNLVVDTTGYNVQIKHQNDRPALPGMPANGVTTIRHNVFSKANGASTGDDARPNLLVGHWPLSGPGANDVYQIYGNFFWANPTGEALFQGEGNVALYQNLFVNNTGPAVFIQPQNDVPRTVRVFNNTVVATTTGIRVSGGSPSFQQRVIGNAVFAATPINAPDQASNVTGAYAAASSVLANPTGSPTGTPSQLDLYPLPGSLTGPALDTSSFNTYLDWNRDFNGALHNGTFRGAYAGSGTNPGWRPRLERKPIGAAADADVSVALTDAPDPVLLGGAATLTAVVSNAGPAPALGTSLGIQIPAGLTFVSSTPGPPACVTGSGSLTCALGDLAPGASTTVVVNVTATATGVHTSAASVTTQSLHAAAARKASPALDGGAPLAVPSAADSLSLRTEQLMPSRLLLPALTVGFLYAVASPALALEGEGPQNVDPNPSNNSATTVTTVVPGLSIADVSQAEGNSTNLATLTATLSASSPFTTTVNFGTADGSATGGSDYVATGGTVTFPPGTVSRTIQIGVIGDRVNEANENFLVNLSGATNAVLTDGQGSATLNNDDAAGLAISDVVVAEGRMGNTAATFTVTLSPPNPTQTVNVSYATTPGTAGALDFTPAVGILTFNPNQTSQTLQVTILQDVLVEVPPESFTVDLAVPVNAAIAYGTSVATIVDPPGGADFNADNRSDLVWRHDFSGQNVLWYMNGANLVTGGFTNPPTLTDNNWKIVGTNDFNSDGRPDFLWRHLVSGQNVVWYMNGANLISGTFTNPTSLVDVRWKMVGTGDFNLDGRADILWRHDTSGENVLWYMNGVNLVSGTFTLPATLTDVRWKMAGVGDFNRDGKVDILWHHSTVGQIVLWYMDNSVLLSGTFATPNGLSDIGWQVVAVGDYNFDERPDIVWRHQFSGQNVIWYMNNATMTGGTFTNPSALADTRWRLVGPR